MKRIGTQFTEVNELNSDYKYKTAFKFNYGTIVPKNETGDLTEYKETYIKYSKLKANDIVINGLNLNYDFVSQRVAIVPYDGIMTSAYLAIRPRKNINAEYFTYLFKAMDFMKMFHGMGTGIRLTLSFTELKKQLLLIPTDSEQSSIVSYLDVATAKMDKFVTKKEQEIELLEKLKQRIIADAVTKGLDPNAEMVPCDIPWIKQIPKGWITMRAKYMFKKEDRPVREEDGVVTCFRDGEVTLRKNRRTTGFTESLKEIGYQGIRKGDLVIHQMDAFAGSCGVSDSDGKGSPVLSVCTAKIEGLNNEYYAKIVRLMGLNGYIQSLYRGIRERSSDFRFETFGNQLLPIPLKEEQDMIVEYITVKCEKIDKLKSGLQQEIEKVKQYKQRLISDVVTGQIKVC